LSLGRISFDEKVFAHYEAKTAHLVKKRTVKLTFACHHAGGAESCRNDPLRLRWLLCMRDER